MKHELDQFGAFSKILWLQMKRKPLWLLAELSLPLLFSLVVLLLNASVNTVNRKEKVYKEFPVYGNALDLITPVDDVPLIATMTYYDTLYYAPSSEKIDQIMQRVLERYSWSDVTIGPLIQYFGFKAQDLETKTVKEFCASNPINLEAIHMLCNGLRWYKFQVRGFEDEETLVNYALDPHTTNRYIGAVIFDQNYNERRWKYSLRFRYYQRNLLPKHFTGQLGEWQTDRTKRNGLDPTLIPYPNLTDGGVPAYWREMFLSVQRAIDISISKQLALAEGAKDVKQMTLVLQRFPYPAHQSRPIHIYAPMLLPLMMMLSFLISILSLSRCVATDQETKVKDYMHVMGLSHFAYWLSYWVVSAVKLIIPVGVITLVFCVIFNNSNVLIILLIVSIYSLNALWFALAIASISNKGTVAMLVCAVLWFIFYLPSLYFQHKTDQSRAEKMAASLLLHNCITFIVQLIASAETQGSGVRLDNLSVQYGQLTLAFLIAMLLVHMLICILIFGTFVFIRNLGIFCRPHKKTFELVPKQAFTHKYERAPASIFVKNLSVVLGSSKSQTVAVKDVTFDAHEGGITVLLGRNGSGKTTILSTLAGIHRITDGQIKVGQYDINSIGSDGRRHFSYCPQFNPLFDIISIKEHIDFYTRIKGREMEIQKYYPILYRLKLWQYRWNFAKTLSGGMKRKLSLAIALCSQSKIVLLDEPTSGLDAEIRREVQSILLQEKLSKLILMSSHYLEEADTLGDQVLLLHRGKLIDKGNSRGLKKKFGEFLNLYLTLQEGFRDAHVREIANLVKKYCPHVEIVGCEGRCLQLKLDTFKISWETLAEICFQLDQARIILKISNIRAAITTLENVFKKQNSQNSLLAPEAEIHSDLLSQLNNPNALENVPLFFQQMFITIYKRLLIFWRHKLLIISQILIPILVVFLGIFINKMNQRYIPEAQHLSLSFLEPYRGSESYLHVEINAPEHSKNVAENLKQILSEVDISVQQSDYEPVTKTIMHQAEHIGLWALVHQYFFSFQLQNNSLTLLFNNLAPHSISSAVNLAVNSELRSGFGDNFQISAINHPLPPQFVVYFLFGEEFVIALCLSLGTLIYLSIFTVTLSHERISGAKHLQYFSGLHRVAYWLGSFLTDALFTSLTNLLLILLLFVCNVYFLADRQSWWHSFGLLELHAWAILPLVYLGTFLFDSASGALAKTLILNLVASFVPASGVAALSALSFEDEQEHLENLEKNVSTIASYIIPQFTFTKSIMTYYSNRLVLDQCDRLNRSCTDFGSTLANTEDFTQWDHPGVGRYMFLLAIQGVVFWLLMGLIESQIVTQLIYSCNSRTDRLFDNTYDPKNYASPVANASKVVAKYKDQLPVLRELSLAVRKTDCACLVGKNGAGKTTLYRVLTGLKVPDSGVVKLLGLDPAFQMHEVSKSVGYCPQHDALLEDLTVVENLHIFCRIRAVPPQQVSQMAGHLVMALGLQEHALKQIKMLSGGNRRKTSLAVSLIAMPQLLLLDEPTAGVDPAGRLSIGTLLNQIRRNDAALLISSHSSDLMESVGTEVVVQEHGCISDRHNVQALAQKRTGFRLKVVAASEAGAKNIDTVVNGLFKGCDLKNSASPNARYFTISIALGATWSSLLNMMKELQRRERLHDFEISEIYFDDILES